jgi:hypothetical protein
LVDSRRFVSTERFSLEKRRGSMSKGLRLVAEDRRLPSTVRFYSDEDPCSLSSYLFPLEEDRCRRSAVRFRRAKARFVVDADRALRSAAVGPAGALRFVGTTSLDAVPFTGFADPRFPH